MHRLLSILHVYCVRPLPPRQKAQLNPSRTKLNDAGARESTATRTIVGIPCAQRDCPSVLLLELLDQRLDAVDRGRGAAGLGDEDLAGLVDDEDAALGALGLLAQANGGDEGRLRVAQQRVLQALLLLEGGVGLGRVGAQAVDGEPVGRKGLVGVAEEADLVGACAPSLRSATEHSSLRILWATWSLPWERELGGQRGA